VTGGEKRTGPRGGKSYFVKGGKPRGQEGLKNGEGQDTLFLLGQSSRERPQSKDNRGGEGNDPQGDSRHEDGKKNVLNRRRERVQTKKLAGLEWNGGRGPFAKKSTSKKRGGKIKKRT